MALPQGMRLGPYEILSKLGEGGMGEVYKARDTRLDRTVAIKILAGLSQGNADSRARFEREARVLASFDHPHICALHDVGRQGDTDFIVMPYVTGETLSARLAKGLLPLPQVIETASQIADALDRAHGHGIIHRDLKPSNVMLTKSGARLLDFGLARLDEPQAAGNPGDLATRSVLTKVGTVMGTVPYMSPEQLHGHPVDARTDIWAFGCVLYEMITGRPPFTGASDAALMGAILRSEPEPMSSARPDVPPALDEIVSGALVKDPEERWQSMRDIRRLLTVAGRSGLQAAVPAAAAARGRGLVVPLLAVLTVILAGVAWAGWKRPTSSPLTRFDLNAPGPGSIQTFTDTRPFFAASPDGSRVAYVVAVAGSRDIWIKTLDGDKPEKLEDTGNASSLFWSADGQSVGFYADGAVKQKPLAGGPALKLCDAHGQGINGTWNADGVVLFSEWGTRKIMRVPATGGTPVMVREGKTNPLPWVHFLPDGRHFLYNVFDLQANTRKLFVGSLDAGDDVMVEGVTGRAEYAHGHLVFWREGGLVAQPFDLKTFQLTGQPLPLADDVHAFEATGFSAFSAAGLLVYQAGGVEERLVWLDRKGLEVGTVGPLKDYVDVRLSPDGLSLAMAVRDRRLGTNDVYVTELARDLTRPLTTDRGTENGPVWSPDSKAIVFAADRRGPPSLHLRSADGTGGEQEVVPPAIGPLSGGSFTPDGRSFIFLQPNAGTGYDIMVAPLDRSGPPVPIVASKALEASPRLSPDGRWLAYVSYETGRPQVYLQGWPVTQGRRQISRDGGKTPRWRGDNKELYFVAGPSGDHLMSVPVGDGKELAAPQLLFVARGDMADYDVRKDGQQFLVIAPDRVADRGTLSVVANWVQLLRK